MKIIFLNKHNFAYRKIKVFAVEKNPNAVVTLQHRKIEEWGDMVSFSITIITCNIYLVWAIFLFKNLD